jgi:hypothetical protein
MGKPVIDFIRTHWPWFAGAYVVFGLVCLAGIYGRKRSSERRRYDGDSHE